MEKGPQKILIIDDDEDILELLEYNLRKDGYHVKTVSDSSQSLSIAYNFLPDLIILDIMMPKINGIEVCRQLRKWPELSNAYIFFLTARSDKLIQEEALNIGGDDFIQKITGLRALSHKVKAVLKHNFVIRKCINEIKLGDLIINRSTGTLYYKDHLITLPESEFELVYFFAQNSNRIITQDILLKNIWGTDVYLVTKTLDNYLRNVTQKVGTELICQVKEGTYKLGAVN